MEIVVTVVNPDGLHIRPASQLVAALSTLDAEVWLFNQRTREPAVVADSPTSLLTLAARAGDRLTVTASGEDEVAAANAVRQLVESGFGEIVPLPAVTKARSRRVRTSGPIGVSAGRAVGPVVRMREPLGEPVARAEIEPGERPAEAARILTAAASVASELRDRAGRLTGEGSDIVGAAAVLVADLTLLQHATVMVTRVGVPAERAVWDAFGGLAANLEAQGGRAAARVTDVNDLRDRMVAQLLGRPAPGVPRPSTPFVLVAQSLAPAELVLLDPELCKALVTIEGGPTSHTAILARAMGMPALVAAAGAMEIAEGTLVLVDGTRGELIIEPSAELVAEVDAAARNLPIFDGTGRTSDGHRVRLLANITSPESVTDAVAANAEGVGLFRTEFCFLDRTDVPTVEEQITAYRPVFAAFAGRPVLVRTLDAGADKPLAFIPQSDEPNSAIGMRGIRAAWRRPELISEQLEAIARAAALEGADVGVMAPMIATVDESEDFNRECAKYGLGKVGVMIETPAAVITASHLLDAVDFVSIGTNDLAQFTMAADRMVADLATLNDPWQPAVLGLVNMTCRVAAEKGKPVGVCGEAAADPLLAIVLVGLGVTSLSMAPRALTFVAGQLSRVSFHDCLRAAEVAVAAPTAAAARRAVNELLSQTAA